MDKSKIYLDLSKCTEEEIKETYKKIKNSNQNIHTLTKRDLINGIVTHCYWFLFFDGNAWNQNETPLSSRTELTYPEFIKLFEGGESKEVLQVDIYSGELNTERISMYKKLSEQYNIEESTVRDIFNAGADWVNKLKFK